MVARADAACALRAMKLVVRLLGALTSTSFAVLTCRLWAEPQVQDVWEFCHWIGQTTLGAFVGVGGCYAELQGSMNSISTHFRKFAMNRIGLSIFYFWLGCYVMGGEIVGKGAWKTMAHVTGIVAWVTAASDVFVSCCADRLSDEEEEEELSPSRKDGEESAPAHPVTLGRAGSPAGAKAASRATAPPAPIEEPDLELPAGGWATSGNKAFGSC